MFPEIEQDLIKWFSLGRQEKLSVWLMLRLVMTQTLIPGHWLIPVGSDFFPVIALSCQFPSLSKLIVCRPI